MGVDIQPGQLGIGSVVAVCALALGLSLVVERVLELLKSMYDLIDCRAKLDRFWTRRAVTIRDFAQGRLRALEYMSPNAMANFLKKVSDLLLGPDHGYSGTVPTIAGDLVRAGAVRLGCKVVGVALGVTIAIGFDIDVPSLFQEPGSAWEHWFGKVATGVAIGLGAGPMHKLIVSLETRRSKRAARVEAVNA